MAEFVTPEGRLSFPALFEPKAPVAGAEPKYSATVLLDKAAPDVAAWMATMQAGITQKVAEKWPNPDSRPARLIYGIKDGDTAEFTTGANAGKLKKEKYPEMEGHWIIQASSKNKPVVVDSTGNPIFESSLVKPGYVVRMSFNLFAYNNVNVGVACGLQNMLLVREGETFGNSSSAATDFGAFLNQVDPGAAPAAPSGVQPASPDSMFA